MKLMPQGSYRWCKCCGRRWYTAHPGAQECPYCTMTAEDASEGWPHACARGHGATGPGECVDCMPKPRNGHARAVLAGGTR